MSTYEARLLSDTEDAKSIRVKRVSLAHDRRNTVPADAASPDTL